MRAGGHDTPDTPRSRRPAGGSSPAGPPGAPALGAPQPASAQSPGAEGRQQHLQRRYRNHRSGAAAAGTRTWGKEPPLFPAARENSGIVRSQRRLSSRNSLTPPPPVPHARPGGGTAAARQLGPKKRSGQGGKARPDTALRRPPLALPAVVQGQPCCSPVAPERTRRPWPLGKSVFNGARWRREASDPGRLSAGSHLYSRGRQPHTATSPVAAALRSGRATAQCRPAPAISAERSERRGAPPPGAQSFRRNQPPPPPLSSPVPSRLTL